MRYFADGLVSPFSRGKLLFQLLDVLAYDSDSCGCICTGNGKIILVCIELQWKYCQEETDVTAALSSK